jgi:hypothetical protein
MKGIIAVLALLVIAGACHAQEGAEMTISLDNGKGHVVIRTTNPADLSELRNIIDEPSVKGIYRERLSAIFGDIENLDIHIEGADFVIEFDAVLAEERDGRWVIERKDFDGVLAPVSTLSVRLPDGMKAGATPLVPFGSSDGVLTWDDGVDFIPNIEYAPDSKSRYIVYGIVAVVLIGLVLARRK